MKSYKTVVADIRYHDYDFLSIFLIQYVPTLATKHYLISSIQSAYKQPNITLLSTCPARACPCTGTNHALDSCRTPRPSVPQFAQVKVPLPRRHAKQPLLSNRLTFSPLPSAASMPMHILMVELLKFKNEYRE